MIALRDLFRLMVLGTSALVGMCTFTKYMFSPYQGPEVPPLQPPNSPRYDPTPRQSLLKDHSTFRTGDRPDSTIPRRASISDTKPSTGLSGQGVHVFASTIDVAGAHWTDEEQASTRTPEKPTASIVDFTFELATPILSLGGSDVTPSRR